MVIRSILQDCLSAFTLSTDFLTLCEAEIVRDITLHDDDRADAAPAQGLQDNIGRISASMF